MVNCSQLKNQQQLIYNCFAWWTLSICYYLSLDKLYVDEIKSILEFIEKWETYHSMVQVLLKHDVGHLQMYRFISDSIQVVSAKNAHVYGCHLPYQWSKLVTNQLTIDIYFTLSKQIHLSIYHLKLQFGKMFFNFIIFRGWPRLKAIFCNGFFLEVYKIDPLAKFVLGLTVFFLLSRCFFTISNKKEVN